MQLDFFPKLIHSCSTEALPSCHCASVYRYGLVNLAIPNVHTVLIVKEDASEHSKRAGNSHKREELKGKRKQEITETQPQS